MIVTIDMDRAREIKREMIRADRAPLLAAADVDYLRALEAGDASRATEIAALKARLRDAPAHPALASASTPETLAALDLATLLADTHTTEGSSE